MTGQRPLTITLRTGHVLTTTVDSLAWNSAPALARPVERDLGLRDLIERIAHQPGTAEAYGVSTDDGFFPITYAIVGEIRAAHGSAFAWTVANPDDSGIVILDELDDLCCESRAWLRHIEPGQLAGLAQAHNRGIGFQRRDGTAGISTGPLRVAQHERALYLVGDDEMRAEIYVAREVQPRDLAMAEYLVELSQRPYAA